MPGSILQYCILAISLVWSARLFAQPAIQWDKTFGGSRQDEIGVVFQTSDGGYIMGGTSTSSISNEKSENNTDATNCWIVKLNADGIKEWDKTYTSATYFCSMVPADRGGYLISAVREATIWLIRIDGAGIVLWEKSIKAGTGTTYPETTEKTSDGGYIIGATSSAEAAFNKSDPSKGLSDYWIIKVSADGEFEWDRTIGGSGVDLLKSVKQTFDGGYIVAGGSRSNVSGDKTQGSKGIEGGSDCWIVKLDKNGSKQWDKTIGGSGYEICNSIEQTPDGGFILGGRSDSNVSGDKTAPSISLDLWIVKLSHTSEIQWDATLSGSIQGDPRYAFQNIESIIPTFDGGYIAIGISNFNAGFDKSENSKGDSDIWLVKLSAAGTKLWDKTIGGNFSDWGVTVSPTTDGGYILGASSGSVISGDKTERSRGMMDYWIVKLSPESSLPVTLKTFTATSENASALLIWQTTWETNSDHFEVEHSADARSWNQIATIQAKGESTGVCSYSFAHTRPAEGQNYYRLKMVDTDGTFTYSKIQNLKFDFELIVTAYPNPAGEIIRLQSPDWSQVKGVQMLNRTGKQVYNSNGNPEQSFSTKPFFRGLYFLKIKLANETEIVQKIVIGE
jgi:hypothetical protein